MKKVIALVIAIVMMTAITVPAFAENIVLDADGESGDVELVYTLNEAWTATIPGEITFGNEASVSINAEALFLDNKVAVKVSTADGAWTLDYYGHDGLTKVDGLDPLTYTVTGSTKGAIANGDIVASISVDSVLNITENLTFTVPVIPKVAGIYKDTVTFTVFYPN